MKELVEVIAKSLVDNPDEVVVTEKESGKALVLELKVAASDMGKVIGKQGRIAKAIRSVVKAAASKDTLLGIDSCKEFIIRVAECNYKFIESHVADIKEKIGNDASIDIVNDMKLEENDCIIETATGVYNCGIDMVLSNLEKDIKSLCR